MTDSAPVSSLMEIVSHTYSTEVLDDFNGEGFCNLHLWTLGRNSEPYLLRIRDFPIFCHLELPLIVNNQYTSWTEGSAAQVVEWLTKVLKDHAPYGWRFKHSHKLYYYRGDRLYPMILLKFKSLEAMKHCRNLLNKHHRVLDLGVMKFEMHETDITPIRKLFSLRKCRYSQWFRISGIEVPYDSADRISTRGTRERPIRELVVAWETLTPVPQDESRSWTTQPRILSFDIETYSDNHRAFPNPLVAKHVVFIVTCVYQILGDPSSREKYALVYGECNEIPGVSIISVTNELDLISAFCKLINDKDPEILTGHNILGFDYPFLDVRLKTKMRDWPEIGRLSGVKSVMTSKTWQSDAYGHNTINILEMSGRLSIDMLPIVRRDYKLEKYTLDYIGKHFLNKGKHDMSVKFMFQSYEKMQKALSAIRARTGGPPGFERLELQKLKTAGALTSTIPVHRSPPRIRLNSPPRSGLQPPPTDLSSVPPKLGTSAASPTQPVRPPSVAPCGAREGYPSSIVTIEAESGRIRSEGTSEISDLEEMMSTALQDLTLVVRYGVQDSDIAIDLFEKLNVWIGLVELSNIVGVSIMEIFTRGQQIRCKSQIYDKASSQGFVIDRRIMPRLWSSGGFVGDIKPGIHENILCFDFASLYPSIIEAYNICYTTLVPPELTEQIPDEQATLIEFDQSEPNSFKGPNFHAEEEGAIDGYESEVENEESDEDKAKTVKKHYKYKWIKPSVRRGLLPQIVHDLVAERNQIRNVQMPEIKKLIKQEKDRQSLLLYELQLVVLDKRQNALKVSANSIFGFLGAQNGLMPLIEGSMCITAMGRQLISAVNTYLIQSYNAVVVYNDSVTGETPLLIRFEGCVHWMQIKQLYMFDFVRVGDDGKQRITPTAEVEVWSDQGWTQIKQVIRHKTRKMIYRVVTHTGCVDVTEDHSLVDPAGLEVHPWEVEVGQNLLHKDLPTLPELHTVDPELAWAWGLFYAEGSCDCYIYQSSHFDKASWAISNIESDLLQRAATALERHEPFTFKILETMQSSRCRKLIPIMKSPTASIKSFVERYREMFYTEDKFKRVPVQILYADRAAKHAFLQGYYAGDGLKVGTGCVFDNKGEIGTAGLYHLAVSIGYNVSLNTREDKRDIFRCTITTRKQKRPADSIKKIIQLGYLDDFVYDLETQNHHFSAGIGRLVVHNTDSAMVDLHLTDPTECHKWGNRIAEEISGVPQHEILNPDGSVTVVPSKPGLFPPPLRIEFEKAMRLANFTKKKYAAFIIQPNGEFQKEKTTDGSIGSIYILTRGIVLARRDNCAWLRKIYAPVLRAALDRQPIDVAFEMITDACADLLEDKVPVEGNLTMIRELGSNYKAANYFIKLFADELRKMGKPANPGDRLEYVVVKTEAEKRGETVLLGKKMRSIEMYNESLQNIGAETGEASGLYPPEDIDYEYYIGNVLINPIDQLFSIGYIDVLPNYRHLEYKAQHSRLHPVSIETPVKMVVKMMTDLQRGGYTLENLGPVIRGLGPWFRAQKEYLDAQIEASKLANRVVKLRIRQ